MKIRKGVAEVIIQVRPDFFHAAGAVRGSVYFKAMDDAAFFAVNSLVKDVFVLTVALKLPAANCGNALAIAVQHISNPPRFRWGNEGDRSGSSPLSPPLFGRD
jgi:hypothetical protein